MQTKTQKHRLPNESETSWKHTPNAKTAKKNDVCTVYGGSEVDRPNFALDSFLRRGNRCYQYNTKNWDTVSLYERPGIFGPVWAPFKLTCMIDIAYHGLAHKVYVSSS